MAGVFNTIFDYKTGITNTCNNIARWDGDDWHPLAAGIDSDGWIYGIALSTNALYIAGSFLTINDGIFSPDIARWAIAPNAACISASDAPSSNIGTMANGGSAGGYANFNITTTTGHYTCLPAGGTPQVDATSLGVASSVTFWASDANGNPSGNITSFYSFDGSLSSLDVSGLGYLQILFCQFSQLTSLDASGCTSLQGLNVEYSPFLTSIDLDNCNSLNWLLVDSCGLTMDDVETLNAFFESLPPANTSDAIIYIGDSGCDGTIQGGDFSIAEDLGWVVSTDCE